MTRLGYDLNEAHFPAVTSTPLKRAGQRTLSEQPVSHVGLTATFHNIPVAFELDEQMADFDVGTRTNERQQC